MRRKRKNKKTSAILSG